MVKSRINYLMAGMAFFCITVLGTCAGAEPSTPNYGEKGNWLSIPEAMLLPVDVFYLYPGVWAKPAGAPAPFSDINDQAMRRNAAKATEIQASAFATAGNLFVPYYRQADRNEGLSLPPERRPQLFAVSVNDSIAAFDHYIRTYNLERPFILAAHAEGAQVLMLGILSRYLKEHPEVAKNMVAAYVLGAGVTKDYLAQNPHLKFAEGRADTGVIVSFTTEAPGLSGVNPAVPPNSIAINPISWTREARPASGSDSLGANLTGFGGDDIAPNFADATVDPKRGVVVASTVDRDKYGTPGFPKGVFQAGDIPFYYYDLRQNALERTKAFLDEWYIEMLINSQ